MKKLNVKSLLLIFGVILFSASAFAQSGADRGKITDVVDGSGGSGIILIAIILIVIIAFVVGVFRSIFSSKK